jgi:hypothetical protein
MRMRVAAIVALVVGITAILAIGGWWYVKDHVRISQASVQTTVANRAGGTSAMCDRKDTNAAHWLCAVSYSGGAPEKCMKVHVRPWGSVDVVNGYLKCQQDPALAAEFTVKKAVRKKRLQKKHQLKKKHRKQNAA